MVKISTHIHMMDDLHILNMKLRGFQLTLNKMYSRIQYVVYEYDKL